MPLMLRLSSKARKIAYGILGTPPNMLNRQSKKNRVLNETLIAQQTRRVR